MAQREPLFNYVEFEINNVYNNTNNNQSQLVREWLGGGSSRLQRIQCSTAALLYQSRKYG